MSATVAIPAAAFRSPMATLSSRAVGRLQLVEQDDAVVTRTDFHMAACNSG